MEAAVVGRGVDSFGAGGGGEGGEVGGELVGLGDAVGGERRVGGDAGGGDDHGGVVAGTVGYPGGAEAVADYKDSFEHWRVKQRYGYNGWSYWC